MPRKNEDKVLAYLNELRVKYNIGEPLTELPPDLPPEDPRLASVGCPIAVALDTSCEVGGVSLGSDEILFPDYVTEFQKDHDRRWVSARLRSRL